MNNHEQAFVSSFVIPEKRARYAEFLANSKRRDEVLNRFNHFFDFVPELATQVPRTSPDQLAALLRKRGAPAHAHLIGRPAELDGCELPLVEAIDRAFSDGWGTVISCLPGRLALYLQEFPPGDAFILATRAA
jgi:hypothetical protein